MAAVDDVIIIIVVATLALNISETKADSPMVPMDSLQQSGHGLSIGYDPDDVSRPDDVVMVT